MPIFSYKALSGSGKQLAGEKVCISQEELRKELDQQGLFVQEIREKRGAIRLLNQRKARDEDFVLFNQEFLALIRAGLTIPEALELAANRPDQKLLGRTLSRVLDDVNKGMQLSEAFSQHPDTFDPLYLTAVRTGEKTGDLATVLLRYQDYLKHKVSLRKQISRAMVYPIFLLITLFAILGILFAFVLPRFTAMYADFDAELPFATRLLVGVIEGLPFYLPVIATLSIGLWLILKRWVATSDGRMRIDRMKQKVPLLGEIVRNIALVQLARTLSTLLASGTPLVEALVTTQGSLSNRHYGVSLERVTARVTQGDSLAAALSDENWLPTTAVKLVEVGEASGSLEAMLDEISGYYQEALDNKLMRIMSLIEPAMMLLMGILVGGVIVVMYLPIFSMANIIQ